MFTAIRSCCCTVLSLLSLTVAAEAAAPRATYVTQQIYNYNHPYAAQLPQELATKMQKMSAGAFAFYRGTAHLFYADMPSRRSAYVNAATTQVWLEGDAHPQNFGAFRDANGNDVFALNDFDEGELGPYVWDVWRLAVGIRLAAQEDGIADGDRDTVIDTFVRAYLDKLGDFKGNDGEKSYRLDSGNTNGVVKDSIQALAQQSRTQFLSKYTALSNGQRRFISSSELQAVGSSVYTAINSALSAYVTSIASGKRYASSYYTLKDVRQKLGSGVGSLGRYRYWLLLEGPSSSTGDDVIVEMKQESSSSVRLGGQAGLPGSAYENHQGERVARSLKAELSNADVLTGYSSLGGVPYFLREKSPYQQDFDYTALSSLSKWKDAAGYFGKALASAHALADKDYDASVVPYSEDKEITDLTNSHVSAFSSEVQSFARDYAQQVQYDYQAFLAAYQSGAKLY